MATTAPRADPHRAARPRGQARPRHRRQPRHRRRDRAAPARRRRPGRRHRAHGDRHDAGEGDVPHRRRQQRGRCPRDRGGAVEALGGIDIVINNAAATRTYPDGSLTIPDAEWLDALDLNFLSAVRVNAALVPAMIERGTGGAIVNLSSTAALAKPGPLLHYGSAKAALIAYGAGLAKELGPAGIRVNTVTPGNVTTDGRQRGPRRPGRALRHPRRGDRQRQPAGPDRHALRAGRAGRLPRLRPGVVRHRRELRRRRRGDRLASRTPWPDRANSTRRPWSAPPASASGTRATRPRR